MRKRDLNLMQENLKRDFVLQNYINNTKQSKPYVDGATGMVFWGSDSEEHKRGKDG